MNKQGPKAIEWTDYTWNPVGGCPHQCRWKMPDGTTAVCYAETVAEKVAVSSYPHGFNHHYWHPERLDEPLKLKEPAKIFLDSMSDLMAARVPEEQIRAVFDVVARAPWHTFQLLTKNAPRLLKWKTELPSNLWVGVSMPPTMMFGKPLNINQQKAMLVKALYVLGQLEGVTRWMSFEPLSFDVADVMQESGWADALPLDWAVIGAASNGRKYYQPERWHVEQLLKVLDQYRVPVFFKGNLEWDPWREDFPVMPEMKQMRMFE